MIWKQSSFQKNGILISKMCLQALLDDYDCTVGSDTGSKIERLRTKSPVQTTLSDKYFNGSKHKSEI